MVNPSAQLTPTQIGQREFRWGQRTYIMGVMNLTPDSFSGDGLAGDPETAVARALAFQEAGADIIDVGGESTRPPGPAYGAGALPLSAEEELGRVIPVIRRLRELLHIPISIDTYKAEVAREAIAAGASLINDVWALKRDPALARVAAEAGSPLVLMHNQHGTTYGDLLRDVTAYLARSVEQAVAAGVPRQHIIVDPGIGFGKTPEQNLELLRRLAEFKASLGLPVLVGASRKSTIGVVLGGLPPQERLEGTAATVALAIALGADMVRVHDVKEMVRVARMSDAIIRGWSPPKL
jgi:dihydropteroate synthase